MPSCERPVPPRKHSYRKNVNDIRILGNLELSMVTSMRRDRWHTEICPGGVRNGGKSTSVRDSKE